VVVLPAVSSVATAFARLGVAWDDALVVSAHGRPLEPALNVLRRYGAGPRHVAVLTDGPSSPARIVEALGPDCPDLHVFERLGEADERHTHISLADHPGSLSHAEAVDRRWESPNLVVTDARVVPPDATWLLGHRDPHGGYGGMWAQPDEEFSHRDGMLTKRDIRAVVLARLAPAVGTMVWDVGAGSGSVAVECARLGAAAIAVERDKAALAHLEANCDNHQVRVKVVHGEAPDALKDLPHPDAVFVGGGGPDVVEAVAAIRPRRVVVALATLERVAPTVAALTGYEVESVLLQVQHLTPLGDGHRLAPANPVFVVSGVLR
jgi:precorrin-6Y C5,15-methyltransferase (decarboxylating)